MTENILNRPLRGDDDAMRLRQLLIDSYNMIGREFNWETRRWEGTYWTVSDVDLAKKNRSANTQIWETSDGQLVGAVVPESRGDIALQIHPDYRYIEPEMIAWAEANLMVTEESGTRWLWIWAYDWDTERNETLRQRGYHPEENAFYMQRRRFLSEPLPAPDVANGYTIRSVTPDESDVIRWVETTNLVFNNHFPADMHRNFQLHSPSHNYDIHTVAVAEDGTFAAFSGLTIDVANRTATFEPVGTHPDHRRKGLAREVMYEGIRRLQQLGTVDVVYVGSWGPSPAGKFYEDVGLAHYATHRAWKLELANTSAP